MSSDNQFKIKKIANSYILYDDSVIAEPSLQLFAGDLPDGDYHTNSGAQQNNSTPAPTSIAPSGIGRAKVIYFQSDDNDLVLKHYYRGGMVARLIKDKYLGFDIEKSRSFREFRLLKKMSESGLPVPDAIAARVEKSYFSYRADLITREIKNVKTLADVLSETMIDAALWKRVGNTIKRFHEQNIYHADLNARNILISDSLNSEIRESEFRESRSQDIYLIDFDNSYVRVNSDSWKMSNLARLNRSLSKFKNMMDKFNYNEESWRFLLDGYA